MKRRRTLLARLLGRSRGGGSRPAARGPAAPPVAPGTREERWLVVATDDAAAERSARFAEALARTGAPVAWARRPADTGFAPPAGGVELVAAPGVAALRARVSSTEARIRLLLAGSDGETVAIAREARAQGARVAYDAPLAAGLGTYEVETERALVADADDLIAADVRAARRVAGLAGGRRLVHVLPGPEASAGEEAVAAGWDGVAASLVGIGAAPTVSVVLAASHDRAATRAAVEAFTAARGDPVYRLALVLGAADELEESLADRESSGALQVLRSARAGRCAAWNLGLVATASEFVVLVDPSLRPLGSGWLAAALARLRAQREIGAVGWSAIAPPGVVATEAHARGKGEVVAALDACGLVAPRAVLARCGGLDEELSSEALAAVDLSFRIRDLGHRLATCADRALETHGAPEPIRLDRRAEKAWRARWAERPAYRAGDPDAVGR